MSRVTWSERLWLPGSCFLGAREHERLGAWPRLWLLLSDGRVLVFALYRGAPNDRHLDALTTAIADDLRGDLLDIPVDAEYGDIRAELEAAGQPIGANDFLIAAHAYALGLTLVTNNTREFTRIRGLKVENWLEPIAST